MFTYAGGPKRETTAVAGSAFSKGHILQLNTASQLSSVNLLASAPLVAGIALADSTESIDSQVPYLVAQPLTRFWAHIPTNVASAFTVGWKLDVVVADANVSAISGDHVVINSANTARVAIAPRGDFATIIDSDRSRVQVTLLGAAAEQAFL